MCVPARGQQTHTRLRHSFTLHCPAAQGADRPTVAPIPGTCRRLPRPGRSPHRTCRAAVPYGTGRRSGRPQEIAHGVIQVHRIHLPRVVGMAGAGAFTCCPAGSDADDLASIPWPAVPAGVRRCGRRASSSATGPLPAPGTARHSGDSPAWGLPAAARASGRARGSAAARRPPARQRRGHVRGCETLRRARRPASRPPHGPAGQPRGRPWRRGGGGRRRTLAVGLLPADVVALLAHQNGPRILLAMSSMCSGVWRS
ncbi:hypothetical protein GA0070623_2786 [Micromonospora rifamycinica]|uniref:Uncharacterized protein n=1 Tax=Micromonospora rifamycinica TaxID=291594 RepID=A0A1C5IQU7_9ACTN|nr:hypothetical protein GA0070623_2786 [Micromonospora rifamycinica]